MSRNIPSNKTWRVTFIERANPGNTDSYYVIAPTKQLALWEGRERHYGIFLVSDPAYAERVGMVRS